MTKTQCPQVTSALDRYWRKPVPGKNYTFKNIHRIPLECGHTEDRPRDSELSEEYQMYRCDLDDLP